ncbi:hypothetical protein PS918_01355 [Pseudomonas fluorescens]|uniref:Uncharacterized protein n=1 Tax=Pseudomonas fluorescens TaxID=294 RepID=A0A5E7RF50_PSEFL|nr:hypothetical protein PS918_01355 [Pseudomonas fluorescens]
MAHLKWAAEMEEQKVLLLPHPLYHFLVMLIKNLFSFDYAKSSVVIVVAAIYGLSILNYRILARYINPILAVLLSVCMLLITPLQAVYPLDKHLYFGYVGITTYHSPTMLLLKPLSLLAFCYALKAATTTEERDLPNAFIFALSLFFCGISKPNFLIIILPAFVLFLLLIGRVRPVLTNGYVYGAFFLPIFLVLGLQFFHAYYYQSLSLGTGNEESHIAFLPFESMQHYSGFLVEKFFLSVVFPLLVFLCYPKEYFKNRAVLLSGICCFGGIILTYLFAETGYRLYAGNFWWSGQIGMYLVFLFTLVFLLENMSQCCLGFFGKLKYTVCMILFFAHVGCGVFFYRQELLFPYMQYW